MPRVLTHCPYCALQCGLSLRDAGGVLQVGSRDFPTNRGGLGQKGWTSAELLGSADRLTTPLVRAHRAASLVPASWTKRWPGWRLKSAVPSASGPDSVAVFGGGGLTNEKAYALGEFARSTHRTSLLRSRRTMTLPENWDSSTRHSAVSDMRYGLDPPGAPALNDP
jgi:assimilatory nitrate reductase catalytic subunit